MSDEHRALSPVGKASMWGAPKGEVEILGMPEEVKPAWISQDSGQKNTVLAAKESQ